jgi:hypothetical protein
MFGVGANPRLDQTGARIAGRGDSVTKSLAYQQFWNELLALVRSEHPTWTQVNGTVFTFVDHTAVRHVFDLVRHGFHRERRPSRVVPSAGPMRP